MQNLNYTALMATNPTVYGTLVNQAGQEIKLIEHPSFGDEYPIIVVCEELKVAACTDFYDTSELEEIGDYTPIYQHGKWGCAYEFDF